MKPVPHNRLTFGAEEEQAALEVVRSGHWAGGPKVAELERRIAEQAGVAFGVAVGSGLAALRLSLRALGVGAGDRVIVPAYSCVALANAVLALGAQPIAADVTSGAWNLDVEAARALVESVAPRAIVAVHTFGCPAPIRQYASLGVPVIEDCAHAFGIDVDGVPLGALGTASVFSFYATKLIGAGEGGMILTNDGSLAEEARSCRDYADQDPDGRRLNDKMTDLEAALALAQLERLPSMLEARRERAQRYAEWIGPHAAGRFRLPLASTSRVWYRWAVEMIEMTALDVIDELAKQGIHAAIPVTDWNKGARTTPISDEAFRRLVSLPLYPTLTPDEQRRVASVFLQVCGGG